MNKVSIYHPRSISLPDGIERKILLSDSVKKSRRVTEEQRRKYDSKTLFFDVFLSADGQTLRCLGPHFVNIGPPRAVRCQGQPLEFTMPLLDARLYKKAECSLVCISLKTAPRHDSLSITMEFADFEIDIPCPPSAPRLADKKVDLMLMTIQKDNPLIWIKDWCQWHGRVHGVQRVILYDNGSSVQYSLQELSSELAKLDVEVLLVNWLFPFGPPLPAFRNDFIQNGIHMSHQWRFAHNGAVNHCRLLWENLCNWCVNLDIDEYLYLKSPLPLRDYLRQRTRDPVVYMDSYFLWSLLRLKDQLPRFFDYRIRISHLRSSLFKYIYQPERTLYNSTHFTLSTDDSVLQIPWKRGKASQRRQARPQHHDSFFKWLWRETIHRPFFTPGKTDAVTEPEIFFYHLYRHNTGWDFPSRIWRASGGLLKDRVKRFILLCLPDALLIWLKKHHLQYEQFARSNPCQFVRDDRMRETAQKAGLLAPPPRKCNPDKMSVPPFILP